MFFNICRGMKENCLLNLAVRELISKKNPNQDLNDFRSNVQKIVGLDYDKFRFLQWHLHMNCKRNSNLLKKIMRY
jgi:hypothetical protein